MNLLISLFVAWLGIAASVAAAPFNLLALAV